MSLSLFAAKKSTDLKRADEFQLKSDKLIWVVIRTWGCSRPLSVENGEAQGEDQGEDQAEDLAEG